MELVNLSIDSVAVTGEKGETILSAAKRNGIEIPNLCFMKDLSPYGACGVCLVETNVTPKLLRACSAVISEGMEVNTKSPRVINARKLALELLMSDHEGDCIGPCSLNCPAGTDCQKYVAEIAAGDCEAAVSTIKKKIPLPASIGRVCPHPCEDKCRRRNVDEAISIACLKAFAADELLKKGVDVTPAPAPSTGKTVGIIGAGPAGLSAAYYLTLAGHKVTVYDKMPKAGGMLRYGIPEYRLPKAVLDSEIKQLTAAGTEIKYNCKIGKDVSFDEVRASHDAVLVATGAWQSMKLGIPGEELEGVFGGIDLLRAVAEGKKPCIGEKTAIVGGGNTAMDACRTAVRLGAKEVSVIYRRTRNEMPAEDIEIEEAAEEGVIFRFLTNPSVITGENGRVTGVKLQVMRLGEPDERGRRSPVPVEGEFVELELDSIIIATGQKNDNSGLGGLAFTKKDTVEADPETFATNLPGVFAAGDNTNRGASIAVAAIAEANAAAESIDAYLHGREYSPAERVISRRDEADIDFTVYEKAKRVTIPARPADERNKDFIPVNLGITAEEARKEAERCLKCGCHDYGDCSLIKCAGCVNADCSKYKGAKRVGKTETALVTIERNNGKCILCSGCVRVCEAEGSGILGLVGRGFGTEIKPEFRDNAILLKCADCHRCVDSCPTGALRLLKTEK